MLEELQDLDTSIVDALREIEEQRQTLQGRLDTMETRRDAISAVVYERIESDYQAQLRELAEQADPLLKKARREFAKLVDVHGRLQSAHEESRLAQEELDFRNQLGEFAEEEFGERHADVERELMAKQAELEEVDKLRESFLASVASPEDLAPVPGEAEEPPEEEEEEPPEPPEEEVVPPVEAEPEEEVAADLEPEVDDGKPAAEVESAAEDAVVIEAADEPDQVAEVPPPGEVTADVGAEAAAVRDDVQEEAVGIEEETDFRGVLAEAEGVVASLEPMEDLDVPPLPELASAVQAPEGPTRETAVLPEPAALPELPPLDGVEGDLHTQKTRILARPRLVVFEGELPGKTYFLTPTEVASIGRSSDNLIQLLEESVSRRHAEILPSPDGFLLRDLGSENGVYVNGKRKKEHTLVHGDIVQVGSRKLRFQEA